MTNATPLFVDAALLAAFAYLGTFLARIVTTDAQPFDDGPPPGRPALGVILCVAALAGVCLAVRGVAISELGMAGVLTIALAGICYADVRFGLVPDVFTVVPLAVVLAGALLFQHWTAVAAVVIVAGPFIIAAKLSKGRGMGWGDVKLVALGTAVLGAEPALLAFTAACFAAVAIAVLRRRRAQPVAFAPYLAAGLALVAAVHGAG